jgi:uncharacterized repeat protein (TIGR03803 family)
LAVIDAYYGMHTKKIFFFDGSTAGSFSDHLSRAACMLVALVGFLGCIRAQAQTATITTLAPATTAGTFSGVISASDGNFYAVSADEEYSGFNPIDFGCPDQSGNDCTFVVKITPYGKTTILHTFETAGYGGTGGAPNHDGFGPTPLVEGSDGNLYGSTRSGGSAGYGTIFKISTSGTFTLLYTFPNTGTTQNPVAPNGAYPSRLIFGKDGNLYGTSQGLLGGYSLFQVTPFGAITLIASSTVPGDVAPQSLVQGTDGSFYGVNGYAVEQITLSGFINVIHNFVMNESQTMQPVGSLVAGPDGNFYGADDLSGDIFQVSTSGSVNVIHTLQPAEGQLLSPEITLASDGNLYGTSYIGGIDTACPSGTQAGNGIGCGIVYEVTEAGAFTRLYSFLGTSVDGSQPDGWVLQGPAGSLYGTFFNPAPTTYNVMFTVSPKTPLPAPIKITFSPENPEPEKQLTVNWSVLNAFSATMQQCHGQLSGGPSNAVAPLGPLTGTLTAKVYSGTYNFTPAAAGSYTFTLNCGGIETGSATVTVGNSVIITTTSPLPGGTVSRKYTAEVTATGGTLPYTWATQNSAPLPAGLTASADTSGNFYITGTPTQFGTYTVGIGVLDSSSPQQGTQKTFQLAIESGLSLTPTLSNGHMGTAYSETASATGGLGPYKWTLASGKLPTGLTLNATTGVISGTPTAAASYKFSITVTDSEAMPATFTQTYTVSTSPDPLTVPYQKFNCKIHTLCKGTFTATGGIPPYTWTVTAHTLFPGQNPIYVTPPPTLTFSTDGSFSGIPTQWAALPDSADIIFTAEVTDSESPAVSEAGTVEFAIASDLAVVSVPLPMAYLGSTYLSPAPAASGGKPPYTWKIVPSSTAYYPDFYANSQGQVGFPTPKGNAPTTAGDYMFNYIVSDSEGVPASASMEATLDILPTPVTSMTVLTSSNLTAGTGSSVVLTATVKATGNLPTGVVTFYNGTVALGTATLGAAGTASLTTTFAAPGTYTLTASYAGEGAVTGSVSAAVTETVVTPTVTASVSPSTLTVAPGSSGTLTLTLTTVGGYTGTVTFSCGSLPSYVGCSFAPSSVTIAAGQTTATDVLTITTNNSIKSSLMTRADTPGGQRSGGVLFAISILPLMVLPLARVRRQLSRVSRSLALAILAVGLGAFWGCGGHTHVAAPGTYSIPITLQLAGGTTQQVTASVIVQ